MVRINKVGPLNPNLTIQVLHGSPKCAASFIPDHQNAPTMPRLAISCDEPSFSRSGITGVQPAVVRM